MNREIIVLHNGVNYELFRKAQLKESHPPTLIYAGNIIDYAGLELAIQALPQIREKLEEVRLVLIGSGVPAYENRLRRLVENLGLKGEVIFLGRKTYKELPEYFKQADIGLAMSAPIPVRKYAFPLKVIEYMAGGLPVIGSKGTEAERIIRQYDCGEAISWSKDELEECVCSLFLDQDKYERYRKNAIRHSSQFSWEQIVEKEYNYIQNSFYSNKFSFP